MDYLKPLLSSLRNTGKTKIISKTAFTVAKKTDSYYHNGQARGTTTYMDVLNPHLRWRNGFLYAFSGYPGAGKSTFMLWLYLLRAQKEGLKIAMYSPEGYPVEDIVEELMRMYAGGNISKGWDNQVSEDKYEEAKKFIGNHFFFLDFDEIPSIQDVLAEFERLIINEGVGLVSIDPFNSIAEGADMSGSGNISQYLKASLSQAKLFATHNQVPVVLIEHPRATGTKSNEDRPEPSPFMIYGGSMWWNKVDVFATVDREMFDSSNPMVSIKIWKVKKQRLMGVPGLVEINFDATTGRYSEIDAGYFKQTH